MNETFIKKGYWYLPDDEENKVAGILTYTPGRGSKLELFGSLFGNSINDHFETISNSKNKKIPIIHGRTSDSKYFTLTNCINTKSSRNFSADFPIMHYSSSLIISGRLLTDTESSIFKEYTVGFSMLTTWLGVSGFKISFPENSSKLSYELKYNDPEIIPFRMDESTEFSFEFNSPIPMTPEILGGMEITQSAYLKVKSDNFKSFLEIKDQISI